MLSTEPVPETAALPITHDGAATGANTTFDRESATYQHFAQRLKEEKDEVPSEGLGEPYYYDTYMILALAATAAGKVDGPGIDKKIPEITSPPGKVCHLYEECTKLIEAGTDIDYQGASGTLDMNENGNLENPLMAEIQVKDGEWQPVDTLTVDPALRP